MSTDDFNIQLELKERVDYNDIIETSIKNQKEVMKSDNFKLSKLHLMIIDDLTDIPYTWYDKKFILDMKGVVVRREVPNIVRFGKVPLSKEYMKKNKIPLTKQTIDIDYFNSLSIKKIKEKVKEIKELLPKGEQNIITYSKNFTISLSNYCQNFCGYCFYNYKVPKIKGNENIVLLNNDQLTTLIQKAIKYNCKEALLMSGERPDSFKEVTKELDKRNCSDYIEFIKDMCKNLLNLNILPHINIGLLTYEELKDLKSYSASMGLMLESTSMELFKKGGVHELSPGKLPENRIGHIKDAGKLKIPFTTGLLLGIGETFENRVNDLYLIKKINEKYDHIQEVIIQNFVYKEGIQYHPENPLSIEDLLKLTGIARLIFENEIAVQIPPNLISGFEKDFIEMGIDDFGGISPFTIDYINPDMSWPQIDDLNHICKKLGFVLKERLPIYDRFIKKSEFCPVSIKKRIESFI